MVTIHDKPFVRVRHAAVRLGVPAAWLRAEAMAGRIPSLRAGRQLLIQLPAAEAALTDRARAGQGGTDGK